MRHIILVILACAIVLSWKSSAMATNGMNMIGYGAVSSGMGGADLAVVDNASAMNINPAGICSCNGPQFGFGVSTLMPQLNHRDAANDADSDDNIFPLPLLTYVQPHWESSFTFGIGAFAQGGMGVEYDGIQTPFATQDEIFSNVSYFKLTPTVGWQSDDGRLKLGASLNIGQAQTEFRYFPNTFVSSTFDGFRVKNLAANGYGIRLGFQYHYDKLTIGGAWLSKTDLKYKDGDLTFASAPTTTLNAKLKGFDWPQQVGLGVLYQAFPHFRIAADVDWVEWSQAIDKVTLTGGPAPIVFDMNWQDQWVYAIGVEWMFRQNLVLRIGFNHGDSPVPDRTLSPLFPAIIEDHTTVGIGYSQGNWQFDFSYEHGFEAEQSNPTPASAGTESHAQNTLHLMLTRSF